MFLTSDTIDDQRFLLHTESDQALVVSTGYPADASGARGHGTIVRGSETISLARHPLALFRWRCRTHSTNHDAEQQTAVQTTLTHKISIEGELVHPPRSIKSTRVLEAG
jgi:hypothetical protein